MKLHEIIPEFKDIRTYDLRYGPLDISFVLAPTQDVYGVVNLTATGTENAKSSKIYRVKDLCVFRRYHVLKSNLGPDSL